MSDPKEPQKKSFSPDWLVRGVLTKLGDTFDKLTGRGWKPGSSLATSELIERLKRLLDSEIRDEGEKGRFVPHRIKLKMQWDKFSTDSETAITKLENELLTAAVDHINDQRYHTHAPLKLEIKPDYFTEGVKLLASFDKFGDEDHEAELNVTVPDINVTGLIPGPAQAEPAAPPPGDELFEAAFKTAAGPKRVELLFAPGKRLSVGRTGSNDLVINDTSISKIHASLFYDPDSSLMVADTGSTNGTFINGERISYGKAFEISVGAIARFGTVDVVFDHIPRPVEPEEETIDDPEATLAIGEFEFRRKVTTGNVTVKKTDVEETSGAPVDDEPVEEKEEDKGPTL